MSCADHVCGSGDDGSRFCTGDRVIVGPERCDRCGSFGTPPCDGANNPPPLPSCVVFPPLATELKYPVWALNCRLIGQVPVPRLCNVGGVRGLRRPVLCYDMLRLRAVTGPPCVA